MKQMTNEQAERHVVKMFSKLSKEEQIATIVYLENSLKRFEELPFGIQFLHKWINIKADHKQRFGSAYGDTKVDQIYRYITIK